MVAAPAATPLAEALKAAAGWLATMEMHPAPLGSLGLYVKWGKGHATS